MEAICVFCGAQNNVPADFLAVGKKMGEAIAQSNKKLVYGGANCGMMGAVANAALNNGAWVTGVFPVSLRDFEQEHQTLSEIHVVDTMHQRKHIMYEKSDAFVIFPGGFGTLDEMFEIMTWRQLRMHDKPVIIFNYDGYWNQLIEMIDTIFAYGFARPETRRVYEVVNDFDALLTRLGMTYQEK